MRTSPAISLGFLTAPGVSGILDGLALNGNAPKVFLKTTRHGLPWVAVTSCASIGLLAYMGLSSGSGKVFGWCVVGRLFHLPFGRLMFHMP